MKNIVLFLYCLFMLSGCAPKASLHELRADTKYIFTNITANLSIDTVKKNIKNSIYERGSILVYAENADGSKITLVRRLDYSGEVMCFFDFTQNALYTDITVYNYVCAKSFIEETILMSTTK